tara:strand:+ start:8866 stop:9681 length:816 start_codon:yes stop_codon:yes gene_type:complete
MDLIKEIKSFLKNDYHKYEKTRARGFHPSQVGYEKFCPRKWVLETALKDSNLQPDASYSLEKRVIFDVGHGIHYFVQNNYLGPMGILWGEWKNLSKWKSTKPQEIVEGFYPGGPLGTWEYIEPEVTIPEYEVIGHVDGIIKTENEEYVLDIKSISNYGFNRLEEVSETYLNQINLYMHALSYNKGQFLFINKNDARVKTFDIVYDKDRVDKIIKERIIPTMSNFKGDIIPDMHPSCSSHSYMRKNCLVKDTCTNCHSDSIESINTMLSLSR